MTKHCGVGLTALNGTYITTFCADVVQHIDFDE